VDIRDATPEDADAACEVLRKSISELCVADHANDPTILASWLSNKKPEIVAAWSKQPGNTLLPASWSQARIAHAATVRASATPSLTLDERGQIAASPTYAPLRMPEQHTFGS
jgi:hypothetical protein